MANEPRPCTGGNTNTMNILVLQITGRDLVLARFLTDRRQISFLQGFRRPLPENGSLVPLFESLGPRQGNERVILAVPPALVHARELTIPIADRRKLRELLPMELSGEIASSTDEMVFDAVVAGEEKVLAVWCRQRDLLPFIEQLAACGLEPEIVTASHLHWNLLLPVGAPLTAITDGAALVIGNRCSPLLVRPVNSDVLQADIDRSISAFELSTGLEVGGRLFVGAARNEGAGICCRELTEAFAGDSNASLDIAGAYAVAGALVSGNLVDFRAGALAYTRGKRELLRKLRLTAMLAMILVLLLFVETGVRYWLLSRDIASLERSIHSLYADIFPSRKKSVDPVAEVRGEIRRMTQNGAGRRVLPVLKSLAELKGTGISGFYEIELDGSNLRLKGEGKTVQEVNDFKRRSAAVVANPELSELKTKGDGGVSFVFRGIVRGVGE